MARTRLFDTLKRCITLARLSERTGESPTALAQRGAEAARERRAERRLAREMVRDGWNRREILAAGVSAAALVGCGASSGDGDGGGGGGGGAGGPPQATVAIVGGGIAGLHAAVRLDEAGVGTRVFEASNRTGGRMFTSRQGWADGQLCELGGELIDTGHTTLHELADELDIALDDLVEAEEGREEVWHFDGRKVTEAEVIEAFRPIAPAIAAAVEAADADPAAYAALDAQSITQWFDAHPDANALIRKILEVAFIGEFGREIDEQSVLNLIYIIDSDLSGEDGDDFRVFGESDERFHAHLGNDTFVRKLAAKVSDRIDLGARLVSLDENSDGRYRLTFERDASTFEALFEQVVLALPFSTLRDVELGVELPPLKRKAIDELGYGTNAKLMLQFNERVWATRHGASGSMTTDNGIQMCWDTSRGQEGASGLLTNFLGGRVGERSGDGTPGQRVMELLPKLNQVFPGAAAAYRGGSAVRMHWPTVPTVKGSYSCYTPGQWEFYAEGAEGAAVDGLFFAGEHTSPEAQGYMEGGAESGARAAMEVLDALGLAASGSEALRRARRKALLAARLRWNGHGRVTKRQWRRALRKRGW